jgi:hypothetical protein
MTNIVWAEAAAQGLDKEGPRRLWQGRGRTTIQGTGRHQRYGDKPGLQSRDFASY